MTPLLGLTIDILVFATVFVYMPIANYRIRKYERELKSEIPVDQWYELDMENH